MPFSMLGRYSENQDICPGYPAKYQKLYSADIITVSDIQVDI
jgi:hypothetical protein